MTNKLFLSIVILSGISVSGDESFAQVLSFPGHQNYPSMTVPMVTNSLGRAPNIQAPTHAILSQQQSQKFTDNHPEARPLWEEDSLEKIGR